MDDFFEIVTIESSDDQEETKNKLEQVVVRIKQLFPGAELVSFQAVGEFNAITVIMHFRAPMDDE